MHVLDLMETAQVSMLSLSQYALSQVSMLSRSDGDGAGQYAVIAFLRIIVKCDPKNNHL